MSGRGCKYSADCLYSAERILCKKSTVCGAVSMQKKRIVHILACQWLTKINLGHHTSYVYIVVVLQKVGPEGRKGLCVFLSPCLAWVLKPSYRLLLLCGRSKQTTERKECTFHHIPWHCIIFCTCTPWHDWRACATTILERRIFHNRHNLYRFWNGAMFSCMCSMTIAGKRYPYCPNEEDINDPVMEFSSTNRTLSLSFQTYAMGLTGWQCTNYFTEKAKSRIIRVLHVWRWVMPLPWNGKALSGYGHFL